MFFTIFDLILILVLFLFIAFGFALGFIQTIGALLGLIIGTWFASRLFVPVSEWLSPFLLGNQGLAKTVAFIVLFTVFNRLAGYAFYLVDKVFGLISIVPFSKSINRLLGALLGFIEGVLSIGVVLYVITHIPLSGWFEGILADSTIAPWFIMLSNLLTWLLPAWLRGA